MGAHCCGTEKDFTGLSEDYKRRLKLVILINALMFLIEVSAGHYAGSQSLFADSLDFLADAATYTLSLWAIHKSAQTRANAALAKGFSLLLIGGWVLGSTIYQTMIAAVPSAGIMGATGILALIANLVSVAILFRYKDGDANVRSVWLCSRNDAISNIAVVVAALGVWGSATAWPDLLVAFIMASLFFWSSIQIIRQALQEKQVQ